ncbi:hypothetical protein HDU86_004582 [Geranomyces michiganensis]|nr:hypothetical protein HDU86_004582 [Geranomyces michiganensis]
MFNNPGNATCILRIIDSRLPFDAGFATVSQTNQFFWVHEPILTPKSQLFRQAFAARPLSAPPGAPSQQQRSRDNDSSNSISDSSHGAARDPHPITRAWNGIVFQWQGIRTTEENVLVPVITPYPSNDAFSPRRPWGVEKKVAGRGACTSADRSRPSTTSPVPMLTVCLPYHALVPDTLEWLYTGDDRQFNQSMLRLLPDQVGVALSVLEHLGIGEGTGSKRQRSPQGCTPPRAEPAAPPAAEGPNWGFTSRPREGDENDNHLDVRQPRGIMEVAVLPFPTSPLGKKQRQALHAETRLWRGL